MRLVRPLLVTALISLAGCGSRTAVSTQQAAAPVDSLPVVLPVTPAQMPAVTATRGGRTLLNVWATWCEPCREEFPALLSVARARAADQVRLVLVSADFPDQLPAVRKFLTEHGVTDTSYLKNGDDMSFINSLSPKWTGALPATFVYDAGGHLVEFWEGRSDSSRFERALDHALAARTSGKESHP